METYTTSVTDFCSTDVVVVGSGSSGATAAITAGRLGADVVLLERYGFMGGISTQVLDTFYGFFTPSDPRRKVIGGVPDVIVNQLMEQDAALIRANTYGAGDGITYDPERLKIVYETLAREAGVRLLYHSRVVDADMNGDRVQGVIAATKRGMIRIEADVVVDASGDADIAVAAGAPFEGAEDGPVQSLTTTFQLINVDVDRAQSVDTETLHSLMEEAIEEGYELPRREGSVHITPLDGVMVTNMTRVADVDATDPEQLTEAEIQGRRQALEYARFMHDKVPGFEEAELGKLSTQIGVRESRRIFGEYRLQREDVVNVRQFDDAIAKCGAPIEEHHSGDDTRWEYLPEGATYDIPYRCLLPQEVDGLLVTGRCLSADHDAHASVRNMGQCMGMGQAAGAAAFHATSSGVSPHSVAVSELRDTLRSLDAVI